MLKDNTAISQSIYRVNDLLLEVQEKTLIVKGSTYFICEVYITKYNPLSTFFLGNKDWEKLFRRVLLTFKKY